MEEIFDKRMRTLFKKQISSFQLRIKGFELFGLTDNFYRNERRKSKADTVKGEVDGDFATLNFPFIIRRK